MWNWAGKFCSIPSDGFGNREHSCSTATDKSEFILIPPYLNSTSAHAEINGMQTEHFSFDRDIISPLTAQVLLCRALLTASSPEVFTGEYTKRAWELLTCCWNTKSSQVKQSNYSAVPNSLYLSHLIIWGINQCFNKVIHSSSRGVIKTLALNWVRISGPYPALVLSFLEKQAGTCKSAQQIESVFNIFSGG